jgi:hypothetical protein
MKPSMPTIAKGNFVSCAPLSKKCVEWRLPRSKTGEHAVRYNTTASVVDASARRPWRILMAFLPTPSGQDYAVASPHATTDQQLPRMDVHGPCQRVFSMGGFGCERLDCLRYARAIRKPIPSRMPTGRSVPKFACRKALRPTAGGYIEQW